MSKKKKRRKVIVRNSLYGLKQAGRGWYLEMSKVFMTKIGFKCLAIDHSVFYWQTEEENTIVAVATDDMAVMSKKAIHIKCFKSKIKKHWDITNHRPIKWFLEFQIKRNQQSRTLSMNQHAYIEAIVEKFRLTNAKKVAIPMNPHIQYSIKQCPLTLAQIE
jgi:Reverse transcriptase (RNA-dependent DNA polymerase)